MIHEKTTVHVALAFDQGYLTPLYVLLTSIFMNNSAEQVVIHAIGTGLSGAEYQGITNFVAEQSGTIHFYTIQGTDVNKFILPDHEGNYLSAAIYYRLFFPFLVNDVSRLLYIDVDTLVVGDLAEIFDLNMGGRPVAAVTDTDMPVRSDLNILTAEEYFNSGILLIDVASWKEQRVTERALTIIQNEPERIKRYPDQDALNMTLRDNWYKLPTKYNLMRLYVPNEVPKRKLDDFLKDQKIIHYNGKKPWFSDCEHRLRHVYQQYARLSPRPAAARIIKVKLSKEKQRKLSRSRLVEFYFDHPEVMAVWRKLKALVD